MHPHMQLKNTRYLYIGALLLALLCVVITRFAYLTSIPPGIWPDEVVYLRWAHDMAINGRFDFAINRGGPNGFEFGLYPALASIGFYLFGDTALGARFMMAVISCATVIATFFLCLEIFFSHSKKHILALLTVLLLAFSYWGLISSRVAFSANVSPLFQAITLTLLLRSLRLNSRPLLVASAIIFGLGFYTYWPYYAILPLVIGIVLMAAYQKRIDYVSATYFSVAVLLVLSPMLYEYATHTTKEITNRLRLAGLASKIHADGIDFYVEYAHRITINTIKSINGLFLVGDRNWRHNFSGAAMLPFLHSLAVLVAFAYYIRRYISLKQHRYMLQSLEGTHRQQESSRAIIDGFWRASFIPLTLLFVWALLGLAPAVLSAHSPHALRSNSTMVPIYMIAAFGLYTIQQKAVEIGIKYNNKTVANVTLCVLASLFIYHSHITVQRFYFEFPCEKDAARAFGNAKRYYKYDFVRDNMKSIKDYREATCISR